MKKVYIYGVVHPIQSSMLFKQRLKMLRQRHRGFSKEFIAREKNNILGLKKALLTQLRTHRPAMVFEESGAWKSTPGDVLREIMKGGRTIFESRYKTRHRFMDAQIINGKKPSFRERDRAMYRTVMKYLKKSPDNIEVIMIVGGKHIPGISKLFTGRKNISLTSHNFVTDFPFGK